MSEYITRQEFDDFKIRVFKYIRENFEPKESQIEKQNPTIPEPLSNKIKQWTKPNKQKLIDELPL
jgi:hypothetical protein